MGAQGTADGRGQHGPDAGAETHKGAGTGAGTGSGAPTLVKEKPKKAKKKGDPPAVARTPDGKELLGTGKAVETMFRNAVRAELDIIALAATKANIMISLNGFIISALMISGAFLFNSSPSFLVPTGVFMLTSAGSIAFALLAASPARGSLLGAVRDWASAVRRREARLRDLRGYVMRGGEQRQGDVNLLIYEDRVHLDPDDYWDRMQELLRDRDEIYHKMSDQLYWLGDMANRKFKLLNISYTIFRWGLVAAIVVYFGMKSALWAFPTLTGPQETSPSPYMGVAEFSDLYEPSAVQQLSDGRILVVEDEASRAVNLLTFGEGGRLVEDDAADLRLTRSFGRTLNDLEGLSIDDDGRLYAITSHSADGDGARKSDREQLLRFRVEGKQAGEIKAFTELRDQLAADQGVQEAVAAQTGEQLDFSELNIEGLAYYKETQQLLLGLRDPMAAGDLSVVVPIENPDDVFDNGADPVFGEPALLDLGGGGIRALSFDPVLGTFLIVNEIEQGEDKVSAMWRWDGKPDSAPTQVEMPGMINLNNVESIDSVVVADEPQLLIMSDEGDPEQNLPAKYLLLSYDQLPPDRPDPTRSQGGQDGQADKGGQGGQADGGKQGGQDRTSR